MLSELNDGLSTTAKKIVL